MTLSIRSLVVAVVVVAWTSDLWAQQTTPRQEVPGNVMLVERDDPVDLRLVRIAERDPVQANGFYGPGVVVAHVGAADYNVYSRSVRAYFGAVQFATFGDGVRGYVLLSTASGVPNRRFGPDGLIPRVALHPDGHVDFNAGDLASGVVAPPHEMRALLLGPPGQQVNLADEIARLRARLEVLER